MIYTGLHAHANGQYGHGHGIHAFRLAPKVTTVFTMLKQNGYRTALLGKQHVEPRSAYPFDFERRVSAYDAVGLAHAGETFSTVCKLKNNPRTCVHWAVRVEEAKLGFVHYRWTPTAARNSRATSGRRLLCAFIRPSQ